MLIIGVTGSICSGKKTLVNFLESTGHYEILVNTTPNQTLTLDTTDLSAPSKITEKLSKSLEKNLIICPVSNFNDLINLQKDSRFILISLDCPIRLRYQRYVKLYGKTVESLRTFIEKDDFLLYSTGLNQIIQSGDRILQNSGSIEDLSTEINSLNILKMTHQRPGFDLYFTRIAELVSTRSGCLVHRGGCVLTHSNKIISTGYSGIPRAKLQCVDGGCQTCYLKLNSPCICSHAELNAIIEAKQKKLKDCNIYLKIFPCITCAQAIIQVKAKRVFYSQAQSIDPTVETYLRSVGIEIKLISVLG